MIANRLPRAVIDEMAREGYRRRYPAERAARPPENLRPTLQVLGVEVYHAPYRGRVYELGYVSFEDGIRLLEARAGIEAAEESGDSVPSDDVRVGYARALRTVARLAPKYMIPLGRVRRLLWRLRIRRNPLRSATEAEVGQFLGFFLGCRTRSRVQYQHPAEALQGATTS